MTKVESLGEFEQTVLLAIVHVGAEAYGVTVRQEIERRTGRDVSIGALYTAFDRLERKGYVRSWPSKTRRSTPLGRRSKSHRSTST